MDEFIISQLEHIKNWTRNIQLALCAIAGYCTGQQTAGRLEILTPEQRKEFDKQIIKDVEELRGEDQ